VVDYLEMVKEEVARMGVGVERVGVVKAAEAEVARVGVGVVRGGVVKEAEAEREMEAEKVVVEAKVMEVETVVAMATLVEYLVKAKVVTAAMCQMTPYSSDTHRSQVYQSRIRRSPADSQVDSKTPRYRRTVGKLQTKRTHSSIQCSHSGQEGEGAAAAQQEVLKGEGRKALETEAAWATAKEVAQATAKEAEMERRKAVEMGSLTVEGKE
jgi:hypothetical protein